MTATLQSSNQVRKIDRADVRPLWYMDFWDGPINGLCLWNNRKYWFEFIVDEDGNEAIDGPRRFLMKELAPQQLEDEERWHELFRQKVGTHCDFEEARPGVKPKELHHEFYEAFQGRPRPDYSKNPVVAWFEMRV